MPKFRSTITGGVRESTSKLGFPWEPYEDSSAASGSSKKSRASKSASSKSKPVESTSTKSQDEETDS